MRIRLPRRPSKNSPFGQFCNEVVDVLERIMPQPVSEAKLSRTTRGTFINPALGLGGHGGVGASLQFKDQFDPAKSYVVDDIVICATNPELDDGGEAGTFIAKSPVSPGDLHPGLETINATADLATSGGAVISAAITQPGYGYSSAPPLTISGNGTGATGHTVVTSGQVTAVVIDAPGTGYTFATAVIGAPNQTQKWKDFALGRWKRLTFRKGKQLIVIDTGRDSDASLSLMIYKDRDDETAGSIQLDLSALLAIASAVDAHKLVIKPRETWACEEDSGSTMRAVVLRSEYY